MKSRFFLPVLVLVLAFGSMVYAAAWTGPSQAPPNGNTPPPINVGATRQTKIGEDICTTVGGVTKCIQDISSGGGGTMPANACPAGQVLTYNGTSLVCVPPSVACPAGQVLTSNGTALVCVDPPTAVPSVEVYEFNPFCGASLALNPIGTFMTYSGISFAGNLTVFPFCTTRMYGLINDPTTDCSWASENCTQYVAYYNCDGSLTANTYPPTGSQTCDNTLLGHLVQ